MALPPSASPKPSPSLAIAEWVMLTRRSATLVVAIEVEWGKDGRPTTQPSRSSTSTRRNEPPLCGISGPKQLKRPATTLLMAHASDSLRPQSTQSMLSRRSMVMRPAPGSMRTSTLMGMPSGRKGSNGSCAPSASTSASGSAWIACTMRRSE